MIPHKKIGQVWQACGIRGQVLTWIESWFSDRRQKEGLGDISSSTTELSEVPEVSVLGPLSFISMT